MKVEPFREEGINRMQRQSGMNKPPEIPGQSFPIPFLKGNKATLVFDKLPIQRDDLEKIKKWIDLFGDSLISETQEDEKPN